MIYALLFIGFMVLVARFRKRSILLQRINDLNWQSLVLLDIIAAFLIFWPLYLVGVVEDRPLNGQTISAICGDGTEKGYRWAHIASETINLIFLVLTSQRDHCADAFRRWAYPLEYLRPMTPVFK